MPAPDSPDQLRAALSHVRWLGGGSGAGKTTIAKRLAQTHGAHLYSSDDTMQDHAARCPAAVCPHLDAFKRMNMDDRWVNRSPRDMLDSFHWFAGEGFELIVQDLLALPRDTPVIAEGFRLLPRLVAPLLSDGRHALWFLPTPAFRRQAFDARGSTWDIPNRTSDPERALANLLARDAMFTDRVQAECHQNDLFALAVDVASSEADLMRCVGEWFFG
ncbi:hypothetical protein [uncultured Tateyamaria sp.]|uniref:hypothetical protein n=1 Tax=uncultured Tateyamaria sp. TaxID=455651 RepID=UPI002633385D|nr:hypothetical protein [uncultured Tateyamaria sp.]